MVKGDITTLNLLKNTTGGTMNMKYGTLVDKKNLLSQQILITKNLRAGEKQVFSVHILGQSYKHRSDLIACYPTNSPQSHTIHSNKEQVSVFSKQSQTIFQQLNIVLEEICSVITWNKTKLVA
jgi:hypothetical protein